MSKYDKASLVHIPSGYKSGTLYNVLPNDADGDFDFSRASTATRVNKDGLIETIATGTPRLDYPLLDGVVQDNPTLLLEPQRTNQISNSENIQAANYSNNHINSFINQTISPDGSQNADKIQSIVNSNQHFLQYIVSGGTANTATISVFLKYIDEPFIQIGNPFDGSIFANFDILNKSIGNKGFKASNQKIEDYGNGWVRCSVTFDNTGVNNQYIRFYFIPSLTSAAFPTYTPSAATSIFIWGLQAENASYSTTYIPSTSGSPTTRSADVCNGAGTAADFNDSEGVLYANIAALVDDNSDRKIAIVEGATQNQVSIGYSISSKKIRAITYDGAVKGETFTNACNVLDFNKIAYKYKNLDNQLWVNGFLLDTSNNTNILNGVTLDNLGFDANASDFYGTTKEVIAFNEALSDTELEALTSYDSFNEMANELLFTIE